MFKLNLIAYGLIGALALAGASFFYGHYKGVELEKGRQEQSRLATQEQLFKLGEDLSRRAAEIETLKREREQYVQEIENEALDSLGSGNPGIGTSGMQRLERRWGTPE